MPRSGVTPEPKPMLLLRLSGLLLLRAAERALSGLLFGYGVTLRFAKR